MSYIDIAIDRIGILHILGHARHVLLDVNETKYMIDINKRHTVSFYKANNTFSITQII